VSLLHNAWHFNGFMYTFIMSNMKGTFHIYIYILLLFKYECYSTVQLYLVFARVPLWMAWEPKHVACHIRVL
jgi:hypothetical protein